MSGVVETPLSVYVVSVPSSFASGRKAHPVGATTPTPCRNGSWEYNKKNFNGGNPPGGCLLVHPR